MHLCAVCRKNIEEGDLYEWVNICYRGKRKN